MGDLIDRDAFVLSLKTRRATAYLSELNDCDTEEEKCRIDDEMYYSTRSFIEVMKYQPVIDAFPVVRCKDCKHRDPEDKKCDCGSLARQGCPFPVDDNYFCGYGERKDQTS